MPAPQTSYSLANPGGIAGQLFDNDESDYIDSKPCGAVALQPGFVVELNAGVLQLAQGTGDPDSKIVWGVVVYKDSMEPGGYQPGTEVPVLRRGRIAAVMATGATFAQGVAANVSHSSTLANSPGTFTSGAVSGTAGSEVSTTKAIWYQDIGLTAANPKVAVVELNLP